MLIIFYFLRGDCAIVGGCKHTSVGIELCVVQVVNNIGNGLGRPVPLVMSVRRISASATH
jgi:hypothetical protein